MSGKKRSKSNIYCCVSQCRTYYSDNISFHNFPKYDKILRSKWIHALNIGKSVSPYMRVCNKHFRDEDFFFNRRHVNKLYRLKPNAVPSQNLPKILHEQKVSKKLRLQRLLRIENQQKNRSGDEIIIQRQTEIDGETPDVMNIVMYNKNEIEAAEMLIALADIDSKKSNLDKGIEMKELMNKSSLCKHF